MRDGQRVAVVIPARNEAAAIANVLQAIPDWADDVVVADNGSTDATGAIAAEHGVRVVVEPRRGYGSACLRGIEALDRPDIVVFLDADYSDYPEEMETLVGSIARGDAEFVVGSRVLGEREPGALTVQARFGNWLACALMRAIWDVRYTDLGPFRAIRYATLLELDMRDPDYGWTVEMQIKAARAKVRTIEVPVRYRKRIGRSKVSGTVRGVVGAGYKILGHILLGALKRDRSERAAVIVFTRYPEPGKTKTRMIPALGDEGAAALQRAMTEHTAASVARVPGRVDRVVRFAGGDENAMREWLGDAFAYLPQGEGDLGARMGRAFREAFAGDTVDRAVIVGSDCPDVTADILRAALDALTQYDVVLGPATDGGYYLIGLRKQACDRAVPAIFEGVEWGTSSVYAATLERVRANALSLYTLAPLEDVDRPEDLPIWERARSNARPRVSVIVPALNEAERIGATIERAQTDDAEVIVVDGGSGDATRPIAEAHGTMVVASERGRARQMNLGSAKAGGEVLLFLHADTLLPGDYLAHVRAAMAGGAVAGAFRFATDDGSRSMRTMAWWANWRARWLGLPYGDQALFVRRDIFRAMGGYRDLPIMEDYDLVRRLRRRGKIRLVPGVVVTSARRWAALGAWRTFFRNQAIVAAWHLGVSPKRLAAYYHRGRGRNGSGAEL